MQIYSEHLFILHQQKVGHFNCSTKNVIYAIHCLKCNIYYIGETVNKLKIRISQHISDIKNHHGDLNVSDHFRSNHCIDRDFRIFVIKSNQYWTTEKRRAMENKLIRKYNTLLPNGLNDKCYPAKQKFIVIPYMHKKYSPTLKSITNNYSVAHSYGKSLGRVFHTQKFRTNTA